MIPLANSTTAFTPTDPAKLILLANPVRGCRVRGPRYTEFLKSFLDDIRGLGSKRIQIIWNNYNDFSHFYKDSIKNINEKTNLPIKLIKEIKLKIKLRKLNE